MHDAQDTYVEGWGYLYDVVTTLSRDGMSSDETVTEDEGAGIGGRKRLPYKKCRVKRRVWRNKKIDSYMKIIDRHMIVKNVFGNDRAGTRARLRVRPAHKASDRAHIPPKLPRNFYDDEWYNGLSQKEKDDLHAQPSVEMLEFEDEDD